MSQDTQPTATVIPHDSFPPVPRMGVAESLAHHLIRSLATEHGMGAGSSGILTAETLKALPDAVDKLTEVIKKHDTAPAPVAEVKSKRRKRRGNAASLVGWPQGLSRAAYGVWSKAQRAAGITENVNPRELKRLIDAGQYTVPAATEAPAKAAKPAAEKPAAAKPSEVKPAAAKADPAAVAAKAAAAAKPAAAAAT